MVPSLGTQLEKGKTLSNTEEAPEEWELLWANQRDPLSLTNRFSSKILGLRAPRRRGWTAARGSEWTERNLELSAHRKGSEAGQLPPAPHKVTQPMQEGGWLEMSVWVTWVEFPQLLSGERI